MPIFGGGIPGIPHIPGLPGIPNPINPAILPNLPFPLPDPGNLPQPLKDLIEFVSNAGAAPVTTGILVSYLAYLEQQASGKLKKIPYPLVRWLRPQYGVNVADVSYAENIDTVHRQAITVERHIYFPKSVDLSNWATSTGCSMNYSTASSTREWEGRGHSSRNMVSRPQPR